MPSSKTAGSILKASWSRCGSDSSKAKLSLSSTKVPARSPFDRLRMSGLGLRWLAGATCGGMLLVLVMGAAVTNTGAAEGWGRSWPLCNRQFVPEVTFSTALDYSHPAYPGLHSLLGVGLTAP